MLSQGTVEPAGEDVQRHHHPTQARPHGPREAPGPLHRGDGGRGRRGRPGARPGPRPGPGRPSRRDEGPGRGA